MDSLLYNKNFWRLGNAYFENQTVNFRNSTIKVLTMARKQVCWNLRRNFVNYDVNSK